jgi:cyclophilin family peptidyl-prolyl cis-trans isomerase
MTKNEIALLIAIPVVIVGGLFIWSKMPKYAKPDETTSANTLGTSQQIQKPQVTNSESSKMPEMTIDKTKTYTALVETSEGTMSINLNAAETPITVNNFVSLAKKGFYENVIFHRVIKGFMIQGGDPTGTGSGGPGYKFDDEPFDGEYTRGTVAMANAGPNTNGSQFFIMHQDYALPKNYIIFGKVVEGLDTLDKIASAQVKASKYGELSSPLNPVKIVRVTITEK